MKKKNITFLFLRVLLVLNICINGCKSDIVKDIENNNIVAYVNDNPIYYTDIDKIIKQELYDELNRIYLIRKLALDETIKEIMLKSEAEKYNTSKYELIDNYYKTHYSNIALKQYIYRNGYQNGIPELKRNLKYLNLNSKDGNELLIKKFRNFLVNKYIDSLKQVNNIKILLKHPIPPVIKADKILAHFRGNLNSKVTFLEISDFECSACRKNHNVFKNLYKKYKDQVKFGFSNFSSYVSICAVASECAGKQNKFWEFYDAIFEMEHIPDTTELIVLADKLNLNIIKFNNDLKKRNIYDSIQTNIELLSKYGLYATPTILINNKLIFNSSSIEDIEQILLEEINKNRD